MTLCHTQIHHTDIKKRTNDSIVLKNIFGTQFVLYKAEANNNASLQVE